VVEPEEVNEVADRDWKLAVPEVCVIFPPTVRLLSVPNDVNELVVIVEPRVVEDNTCDPPM
jgi:hypothetical protein